MDHATDQPYDPCAVSARTMRSAILGLHDGRDVNQLDHIQKLRKWPGAFGIGDLVESSVAYLLGYDAATDGAFLAGFREWLVLRLDDGANLGWPALLARLCAAPEHVALVLAHQPVPDEQAVRSAMFDLVEQFLRSRGEQGGLEATRADHERWIQGR